MICFSQRRTSVGVRCGVVPILALALGSGALQAGDGTTTAGSLLVESEPPGASVFVDGRLSGETPVTLTTIPVGVHRVRVVRLGYLENSRMVTIRAGVPAVLRARLTDPAPQTANATALRIVVLEGEGAVNIIQQKTAVAPVIEVRDRNDQPVSGAVVRFAIRNGRATFSGARSLAVATDAAGRAAATGFAPTGTGTLQIGATATFQGQTAAITIAQTNVLTAAQAAGVAAGAGSAGGSSAGATAGAGGGGGGLSTTTLAVVGAAAVGGTLGVKKLTGGATEYSGQFSGTLPMVFPTCTRFELQTGTLTLELTEDHGAVNGEAKIDANVSFGPGACQPGPADTFGIGNVPVSGTANSVAFTGQFSNTGTSAAVTNTYAYVFAGSLNGDEVVGTLRVTRTISNTNAPPPATGSVTYNVTLR